MVESRPAQNQRYIVGHLECFDNTCTCTNDIAIAPRLDMDVQVHQQH